MLEMKLRGLCKQWRKSENGMLSGIVSVKLLVGINWNCGMYVHVLADAGRRNG